MPRKLMVMEECPGGHAWREASPREAQSFKAPQDLEQRVGWVETPQGHRPAARFDPLAPLFTGQVRLYHFLHNNEREYMTWTLNIYKGQPLHREGTHSYLLTEKDVAEITAALFLGFIRGRVTYQFWEVASTRADCLTGGRHE